MALPRPQREALEAVVSKRKKILWKEGVARKFRLAEGAPLFLLGVNRGVEGEDCFALFGYRRAKKQQSPELLTKCSGAALLTGPEDGNRYTVEGLHYKGACQDTAVFSRTGRMAWYRPTSVC